MGVTDSATYTPADYNPRRITDRAARGLEHSLRTFGDLSGFVLNDTTGNIICGHQRQAVLSRIDWGQVRWGRPYKAQVGFEGQRFESVERTGHVTTESGARFHARRVSWPLEFERAANVEANNPAIQGEWTEELDGLLAEIREDLGDDDAAGLLLDQLQREQCGPIAGQTDPDDIPEPPAKPITKPGDLWVLGEHRLLAGDSTERESVHRVLDNQRCCLMFTDPPYGVVFGSAKKNAISGDLTQALIPISFAMAIEEALDADARLYVCGGSCNYTMYDKLFDYHLQQKPHPLIWVKESFVLRPNNYHSQFEIVYFGWRGSGGGSAFWSGDRKQSDVWQFARDGDGLHPTEKPVELVLRAVRNSSPSGGMVYDPFSGSGTTLIACEQLDRKCRAIEIEPRYCDVAVKRWEAFTGKTAVREKDEGRRMKGEGGNREEEPVVRKASKPRSTRRARSA